MKTRRLSHWVVVIIALVWLAGSAACTTRLNSVTESYPPVNTEEPATSVKPGPVYLDFPDVPVPQELARIPNESYVFQGGGIKAGLLALRGRVDPSSLYSFFEMSMPRDNWKLKGSSRSQRSVMIFEKPEKGCVIHIYERRLYTYVEVHVVPYSS